MGKDAAKPWIINPREDRLARMPWPNEFKAELNRAFDDKETYYKGDDIDAWLDSMTYKELLEKEMGFSSKVTEYFDPIVAISMGAVCCDVLSAYSARQLEMPGTEARYVYDSPSNAIEFCQGTFSEMEGEDIYQMIEYFTERQKVLYVHFRNVSGTVPKFNEEFINTGYVNMKRAMGFVMS